MDSLKLISNFSLRVLVDLQLQDIKKLALFMNIPIQNKRKDLIIEDINKVLYYMMAKPKNIPNWDLHLINYDLDYLRTDPHLNQIIIKYQEAMKNNNDRSSEKPKFPWEQGASQYSTRPGNPFHTSLHQLVGENTKTTPKSKALACLCGIIISSGTKEPHTLCINEACGRKMHTNCTKLKNPNEEAKIFECFDCVLRKCDPLHEILSTLQTSTQLTSNKKIDFYIDNETISQIKSNENIGIEVRCIRLEEKYLEQTWPQKGSLCLNNKKELEFKPLQNNSSLKKRRDEKFFSRNVNSGSNSLVIKFEESQDFGSGRTKERPSEGGTFVIAVYLIKKLKPEELIEKVKQKCKRDIGECKKRVVAQFTSEVLQIDKLRYNLCCSLDMRPLKTPAKGAHCKHANCFSLENFVNVWQKNNQRKWQCPICKLKAYDIVVDTYFQEIMQAAKELEVLQSESPDVVFSSNGEYTFPGKEKELQLLKLGKKLKGESRFGLESKMDIENAGNHSKKSGKAVPIVLDIDDDEEEVPLSTIERTKEENDFEDKLLLSFSKEGITPTKAKSTVLTNPFHTMEDDSPRDSQSARVDLIIDNNCRQEGDSTSIMEIEIHSKTPTKKPNQKMVDLLLLEEEETKSVHPENNSISLSRISSDNACAAGPKNLLENEMPSALENDSGDSEKMLNEEEKNEMMEEMVSDAPERLDELLSAGTEEEKAATASAKDKKPVASKKKLLRLFSRYFKKGQESRKRVRDQEIIKKPVQEITGKGSTLNEGESPVKKIVDATSTRDNSNSLAETKLMESPSKPKAGSYNGAQELEKRTIFRQKNNRAQGDYLNPICLD